MYFPVCRHEGLFVRIFFHRLLKHLFYEKVLNFFPQCIPTIFCSLAFKKNIVILRGQNSRLIKKFHKTYQQSQKMTLFGVVNSSNVLQKYQSQYIQLYLIILKQQCYAKKIFKQLWRVNSKHGNYLSLLSPVLKQLYPILARFFPTGKASKIVSLQKPSPRQEYC